MTATWFWADTHYGHRGILKHQLATRPYADVDEMNEALIDRWNSTVRPDDTIWFAGDFALTNASFDLDALFLRLRGHKHLVIGNHDEENRRVLQLPWESQQHMATVKQDGMRAVVCHYALETWKHPDRYIMVHGHSHGTLDTVRPRRFDVGADCFWTPVQFEQLWETAGEYEPVDHHGKVIA